MNKQQAQEKLLSMTKSLQRWLEVRTALDQAAQTQRPGAAAPAVVAQAIAQYRDRAAEAKMSAQMRTLLAEAHEMDEADFANYGVVQLAKMVLSGDVPGSQKAAGLAPMILLIVVGGGIFFALNALKMWSDRAREKDEMAACKAGVSEYCPKTSLWVYAAIAGGVFVVWTQTSLLDPFKKMLGGKKRRR